MKDSNFNTSPVLGIIIGMVGVVFLALKLLGSSFAGTFLLIAGILLAVFLIVIILITVFAIGMGKKDYDKKTAFSRAETVPDQVKTAKKALLDINPTLRQIRDPEVRTAAREVYGQCQKIIDTVAAQPDELKKSAQFFNYYLPTFATVLEKFATLEAGGVADGASEEKMLSCLTQMKTALEKQYRGLFSDEMLDLTVETKALETIIKKDGLD